ncbi:MAG TPA: hypothetical protein VHW96_00145 [Solirubrobacteraceae bacterium]|nr:hypothetical protein [Solirubrobacteraceae bacterium]
MRSGVAARLRAGGLAGDGRGAHQIRAGLAWLGAACAAFLAFVVAEWAQITVGRQWSAPSHRATTAAMLLMSGAALGFVAHGLLAAIPLGWGAAPGDDRWPCSPTSSCRCAGRWGWGWGVGRPTPA